MMYMFIMMVMLMMVVMMTMALRGDRHHQLLLFSLMLFGTVYILESAHRDSL